MSQPDDFELSTIEDLDPEPSRGEGLSRRREFALGGVLLLLVLLWALWQVWTTESKRESYRRGGEAAGARNWDEARSYYEAASGYKDADSRAADAARNISERDRYEREALDFARRRDWMNALRSAREVERIQPGYLQTTPGELARAQIEVYLNALHGTVALRTEAQPPGLYYRAQDRWIWLEGSDQSSSVLGTGPPAHVVYDVPGGGTSTSSTATPSRGVSGGNPGTPELKGRRLRVASLVGREVTTSPLDFDPAEYNFYVWGKEGVWAFRFSENPNFDRQVPVRTSMFERLEMAHQYYGSPVSYDMALPGPNWMIMDLSPDGSHLLLADWDEPVEDSTTVRLHIAHGNGSDPSPVYSHTGGFYAAQFGLLEHDILLSVFSPTPPGDRRSETQALLMPDLQEMTSPRVLAEGFRNLLPDSYALLQGAFVREGPFAGRLVVAEWNRHGNIIKLINPHNPSDDLIEANVPDSPGRLTWTYEGTDDGLMLYTQNVYGGFSSNPSGNTLFIVKITRDRKSSVVALPIEREQRIAGAAVRGGYLVYSSQPYDSGDGGSRTQFSVYSARLSKLEAGYSESTLFYSGSRPADLSPIATSWHFGSGLLAYVRNGELHARTYRGDADVILETGVAALYDSSVYETVFQSLR